MIEMLGMDKSRWVGSKWFVLTSCGWGVIIRIKDKDENNFKNLSRRWKNMGCELTHMGNY